MDVLMTYLTDGHSLSPHGYHSLRPRAVSRGWVLMQVFHCSHVMHLYIFRAAAEFTHIC